MEGFSKYFTFEELTDTSHKKYLKENREEALKYQRAGKRLSKLLESIRHVLGDFPLTVSSGFRCLTLNAEVKGSPKSKHMKFEAADIVPTSISVKGAFDILIEKRGELTDLRKVIIEQVGSRKWLHIEVKMEANEEQSFWMTTNAKNFTRIA